MRVSKLSGVALDYAVSLIHEPKTHFAYVDDRTRQCTLDEATSLWALKYPEGYEPSTNWWQGGHIIDTMKISIIFGVNQDECPVWSAIVGPVGYMQEADGHGKTALIAAMRACVASVYGEEIVIPEILI